MLLDAAASYEDAGFYQISAAIYQRVRRRGASRADYRRATLGLARSVLGLGNPKWALKLMDEAGGDEGRNERARAIIGWASAAEDPAAMRTAARWLGDAARGRLSLNSALLLARFHMARGQKREAAELLQRGLDSKAEGVQETHARAEAWCLLGDVLAGMGRGEEAGEAYLEALGGDGWGFYEKWAAYSAARLGHEAGDLSRVRPYLERLLKEPEGSFFRELARLLKIRSREGSIT